MPEESKIYAAIQCMGYGYTVKVIINGKDIGIEGCKSEGKRLFWTEDPLKAEMEDPLMRERLFILNKGANKIHVEYTKTGVETDKLTFEFFTDDNAEPLLKIETSEAAGAVDKDFAL